MPARSVLRESLPKKMVLPSWSLFIPKGQVYFFAALYPGYDGGRRNGCTVHGCFAKAWSEHHSLIIPLK